MRAGADRRRGAPAGREQPLHALQRAEAGVRAARLIAVGVFCFAGGVVTTLAGEYLLLERKLGW